jgi:hypothetical protein
MGGRALLERMSLRRFRQGGTNQSHPSQGKRLMVFLRRAMVKREPTNTL